MDGRTTKGLNRVLLCAILGALLQGCAQIDERKGLTPCTIAIPERTLIDKNTVLDVGAGLTTVIGNASVVTSAEWRGKFEQTYQRLKDDDVSCAMLLRTVACLSEQGRPLTEIADFREYLRSTHACEPTDQARLSVDSVVQQFVSDAYRFQNPPIAIDVFVRNSGDRPAQITTVKAWFDENLRSPRAPSEMVPLSEVYAVTIDSTGARVRGTQANLNSPVSAWYPSPTEPVLIVETPVAQSLGARSTDRFRIQYNFLDSMTSRGPRDQIRLVVNYNDGSAAESKPLKLVRQAPCAQFQVQTPDGPKSKSICRDDDTTQESKK